jgi:hypothetical protein
MANSKIGEGLNPPTIFLVKVKGNGKVHPRTSHEGPEGE